MQAKRCVKGLGLERAEILIAERMQQPFRRTAELSRRSKLDCRTANYLILAEVSGAFSGRGKMLWQFGPSI